MVVLVVLNTLYEIILKKQDIYSNVSCYIVITVTFPLSKYLIDSSYLGKVSVKV